MIKSPLELDFDNYIRNVEPDKKEKSYAWATAIGLQQVDRLKPSSYLLDIAKKNIEGEISIDECQKLIDTYYQSKTIRTDANPRTEEADKVSSRMAAILSEKSFNFSPSYLLAVHHRLFQGIYKFAGKIRDYDITKKEWVLDGDMVTYGAAFELPMALDYDFEQERRYNYHDRNIDQIIQHICFFVSRLWQIHPFGEGNTRTTAVFTIKYLRYLGFTADNDIFAANSWYFRNALVRANYKNLQKGIQEEPEFLEKFFRNLLNEEQNELKNRFCHIEWARQQKNLGIEDKNLGIEDKNLGIEDKSLGIGDKSLGIGDKNLGIGDKSIKLNNIVLPASLNKTSKDNILKILNFLEADQIFGAGKIVEILNCSPPTATAAIKKLKEIGLIEAVSGKGKGKYRLK